MQRRVTSTVVGLEHPDFMQNDQDVADAISGIEASLGSGKGKYRKGSDRHVVDLELPALAGDSEGSWLSTLGEEVQAQLAADREDPRAAAMRAIIAQGIGSEFAPRPDPALSDNAEFRTRTPMPDQAVPETLMTPDDVKPLPLNAFHGLVYSQVFGPTTVRDIKDILGTFGEDRVLETLDELCLLGVLEVPLN